MSTAFPFSFGIGDVSQIKSDVWMFSEHIRFCWKYSISHTADFMFLYAKWNETKCWPFNHLTLQELLSAVDLN